MNCQHTGKYLSAWLDGELACRHRHALQAHLQDCEACRRTEQAWRDMGQHLRTAEVVGAQTPEAAWQDVQRALRLEPEKPARQARWIPGAWTWTTAGLALLLLGFGLYFNRPDGNTVPQVAEAVGGVEYLETGLPGASSMVYVDDDSGMTVVWVVEAESEDNNGAG